MKVIFAGTPEIANYPLQALIDSDHEVVAVYTQPDRPAGRGRQLTASPVKQLAQNHGIAIEQPLNFKEAATTDTLKHYQADILIVMAYGLILPTNVLQATPLGAINIHVSLLPKWRGAAPIQHAILAGDTETGVTIMQIAEGLDTGDILLQRHCDILGTDTSQSLHDKLGKLSPEVLLNTLDQLNTLTPQPQDNSQASYAGKITKAMAKIDWSLPANQLDRCIRAYTPWPIAFSTLQQHTLRIWAASTQDDDSQAAPGTILRADKKGLLVKAGEGALLITQLQLPGKRAMAFVDVLNAHAELFQPGNQFD